MASPFQSGLSRDIASGVMVILGIFVVSALIPLIGFIAAAFIPLPVFFYRIKLGRRHGMWVPFSAIVVISLATGGLNMDTAFFSGLMVVGFVLGEMVEKTMPVEITILAACASVLGLCMLGLVIVSGAAGIGVVELVSGYVKTNLELSIALYKNINMPPETIDTITRSMDQILYTVVRLLPSMITASMLFVAWINFVAGRSLMVRQGLAIPDYGHLNRWQAPGNMVWGIAAGLVLVLTPATGWRLVGVNALLVLMVVYFIQGIAVVSFFLEARKVPRAFRVLLYSMIAFQQLFALMVVGIGFFDIWIDFRKLASRQREPDLPD